MHRRDQNLSNNPSSILAFIPPTRPLPPRNGGANLATSWPEIIDQDQFPWRSSRSLNDWRSDFPRGSNLVGGETQSLKSLLRNFAGEDNSTIRAIAHVTQQALRVHGIPRSVPGRIGLVVERANTRAGSLRGDIGLD
jgi:hypothetical protein